MIAITDRQSAFYEDITIESGGVPIRLSVWEGPRESPCVVFLPGTVMHPLFYAEFLRSLAEAGFHVVGVHYLSHGRSPRLRRRYTFSDLVRNAQDAVTYAIGRFGCRPLVLGSSQGAMVAVDLASRDPRLSAVIAHNLALPQLPESLDVTRLPGWLRPLRRGMLSLIRVGARLLPTLPVPWWLYLSPSRIFQVPDTEARFRNDPLAARFDPLCFVASLLSAEIGPVVRCPFVLLGATGDPCFPLSYQELVFDWIQAPQAEMLRFRLDHHLLLNDCVAEVLPALAERLRALA